MRLDTEGVAVHVVPPVAEDEQLIALARLLGFEIGDDNGPYYLPRVKLREALGLPYFESAPTKTQAARDALKAMADAILARVG